MYNLLISKRKNILNLKPNGGQRTTTIDVMIALIQKLVTDDGRLMVRQLAMLVDISLGAVETCSKEHLKLRKISTR